ncbi:MAG: hypothetical protein CO119_04265 [Flavobacteriales bacterium CG_4_9_14_3_um_filter_40_17]|nr:MAG: hypothetical protein CO119_04265 [Flavobacteriales bacterium CG_4_9_14_3_um_filter_40_17]
MKKLASIFLLTIYLFANTSFCELIKIGVFVNHFKEHQFENEDINLYIFVTIHYFSGNVKDDDYDRDMELPFKSHDVSPTFSVVLLTPSFEYIVIKSVGYSKHDFRFYKFSNIPTSHLSEIWQPPKYLG